MPPEHQVGSSNLSGRTRFQLSPSQLVVTCSLPEFGLIGGAGFVRIPGGTKALRDLNRASARDGMPAGDGFYSGDRWI
jgi:hypothetical protein